MMVFDSSPRPWALLVAAALASCHGEAAPPSAPSDPVVGVSPPSTVALPAEAPAPVASTATGGEEPAAIEQGAEGDESAVPPPPHPAAAGANGAGVVAEIDRELSNMRSTTYTHHTTIDESAGRYDYDCSGFVGYALQASAPAAFAEVAATTVRRPLAKHYVSFFSTLPPGGSRGRWARVARVSDLQPGDVVAWLRPADVTTRNTGHVLFVRGPVSAYDGRADAFVVPIADSTHAPHGRSDPRMASHAEGLGTGTIVLLTDSAGHPTGYQWSTWRKSVPHATTVAMARVVR
jgi:hypothetical protein